MGKKICVLFIDWEAQFSCTINYVQSLRELYTDVIEEFYWVALPLTTQNSLSQYQPEWQCWEPDVEWVRQPPQDAITDPDFFSFYQPGMTFEQFVREFAEWFSQKRPAAMMIGIRADESYNRFVAIASLNKQRFADDKPWTTAAPGGHSWYIYPIYDWKGADRTDAIFISRRGSRLSRQQAYRIIRDAGIEAGTVTQTHPHMLRHACGYELAERGADTRLIQDYLGHRNIRHTVRYTASNAARFAGLWERNNLINEKLKREEV